MERARRTWRRLERTISKGIKGRGKTHSPSRKENKMGMSSFVLDIEEKFWDHAHKIVGDCESHKEFKELMFKFDNKFLTTFNSLSSELDMFWDEFWS